MAIEGTRATGSPHRRRPASSAVGFIAVVVAVALLVGRFLTAGQGDAPAAAPATAAEATTAARIAALQQRLRETPDIPRLLVDLGAAYLARARQTADPTYFAKAAEAVERANVLAPADTPGLVALGLVQLARHDFSGALARGREALALTPSSAAALGVVTDALVELGRYDEAVDAAQRMVDRRPDLPSYSRVSYVRELHGDVSGARIAMQQASTAGADSAPDVAYVRTLLGDLELGQGRLDAAESAYAAALSVDPTYGLAASGLARVLAARGDIAGAIRRLEPVTAALPLPDAVALLGDLYVANGRTADGAEQYALVRTIEQLNRDNGVAVDLELARFEADHVRDAGGNPARAVELAQQAVAARPTVFASDVLGWALRQAGRPAEALPAARDAVALGTRDALLWYHLAATEHDLGQRREAAEHLRFAFSINPFLTVRDLPEARKLATALGVEVPA